MIIECPACNTKYDIKVELPPEGRSVRCAKCEHVWRAAPVEDEEDYSAVSEDEDSDVEAGGETEDFSAFQHTEEEGEEQQPFAEDPSFAADAASAGEDGSEEEIAAAGSKGGWFANLLRKNQKFAASAEPEYEEPEYEETRYEEPHPAAASPEPMPRPAIASDALAQPVDDVRTLDDARAAVRNVFASLGEQRPYPNSRPEGGSAGDFRSSGAHNIATIQAPVTAYADTGQEEDLPFARAEGDAETGVADWQGEAGGDPTFAQERDEAPAGARVWPSTDGTGPGTQSWLHDWQDQPEKQQPSENDLDTQLRAALQAHFPSHSVATDQSTEDPFQQDDAGDEAAVSDTLTAFWKRPATIRSEVPGSGAQQDEEDGLGELSFDEQLFDEIEETQEHAIRQVPGQQNGALALAAAWGLFLCVAGGLISGLFAFRDIAAGAMPGLASFYRAVGMPVTAQPLIFEGVQYEWTVSEFKPVLHIKGAVYNRAQRGVKVPDFVVSIKDNDPALDKEFPASLPIEGEKISPEERTEFEIELVSPSPSITAVELELRNVR